MAVVTKEAVGKALKDRPAQLTVGAAAAAREGLAVRRNGHDGSLDRAYRLKSEESPSAGMRRIVNGRIDKAAERLADAQVAEDPTSCVHGARKDLKKLRFGAEAPDRQELGDERYRAENSVYREAGRLLSASRDAEVKVETLEDICERFQGTLPSDAADEWLEVLGEERDLAVESTRHGEFGRPPGSAGAGRERSRTSGLMAPRGRVLGAGRARHRARLPAGPQADAPRRRRAERGQRPRVAQARISGTS